MFPMKAGPHRLRMILAAGCPALLLLLSGCGAAAMLAPQPPTPKVVQVALVGAPDTNPNQEGRPSPVVVRLYVLKDAGRFSAAEFDALSADPGAVLADGLLGQERQLLRPGETVTVQLKVDPEATYLGVVAEFRDTLGTQWRAVMAAPEKKLVDLLSRKPVRVDVTATTVRVAAKD